MSKSAWIYTLGVISVAGVLVAMAAANYIPGAPDWQEFVALTVLATFVQLVKTTGPNRTSYYPHFVFFFAGALLLQPFYFVLLIAIPHLIEWAKERMVDAPYLRAWYIQPFNIASHLIAGFLAGWAYQQLQVNWTSPGLVLASSQMVSALLAAAVFILVNHMLVGVALALARGISLKVSGALGLESLLPDYIMACLGYVVAVVWQVSPWLLLPTLLPLALMRQGLMVPQLQQDAQTDSKTGLWNARHFTTLFTAEMDRASKFNRPLALIMADLDLLRNINNTYGHLAGDSVLAGIGSIIRDHLRQYDFAGRFGGEEFAIVLPEVELSEAQAFAEQLRCTIEAASFEVPADKGRIKATMSLGVACFPADASDVQGLIHQADLAVYQAKLRGRNCVACAGEVPHSVKLQRLAPDRLHPMHTFPMITRPAGITEPVHGPMAVAAPVVPEEDTPAVPAPAEVEAGAPAMPSDEARPEEPAVQPKAPAPQAESPRGLQWLLGPFIGAVITTGVLAAGLGVWLDPRLDILVVGLLALLAVAAEAFQINLYGDNTISVSVAVAFAAAIVAGVPGVAIVSLAIALTHFVQRRPALYKTAFNWSVHVLAGLIPVLAMRVVGLGIQLNDLLVLAPVAVAAGLLYFVVESGLFATVMGLASGRNPVSIWRDQFKWLTLHYVVLCTMGMLLAIAYAALGAVGVLVFSVPVIMMRFSQKQYVERTEENMRELKRMNQELTAANQEIRQANVAIRELNEELFLTLARIIDARDPYVGGHANKVADYAAAIAAELGMETERIEPLRQAGFLHDIGKIGVSEQVLHKPAKLTREEYEYVKTHAPLGGELLMMCRGLRHLAPFVRHHHERWDGTGYPDRLAGEKIPLEARILAVCDAAEAMASDRPYRKGMSPDEVIDEVRRCAGTQFDPRVARAFVSVAERERDNLLVNSAYEVDQRQYSYKELLRAYRSRSNTTAKRASLEATAATSSALH